MANDLTTTVLTSEQKSQITAVISVGCDWRTAADYAGCKLADIRRAMQNDPQFAADLRRSQARIELNHMQTIRKAAEEPKNYRASMWWLERHAPERFGPRSAGVVTARQLKAYLAILASVLNGGDDGPMQRSEVLERLRNFALSIDELMRDERMNESEAMDSFASAPSLGLAVDHDTSLGEPGFHDEDVDRVYD
jgi:hypothetical protein